MTSLEKAIDLGYLFLTFKPKIYINICTTFCCIYGYVSIYSEECFWPQYMYHKLSPFNGCCWYPLGKLSHLGLEQLKGKSWSYQSGKKNSSSSMDQEGDNENDEYYVLIKTRSGRIITNPNRFWQAASLALGLSTFQCNDLPQTSRPGSIETIRNKLDVVSIFKTTMDHMDLISLNSDYRSINLVDSRILAAKNSQKYNLHLGKAIKADDSEDFMRAMKKRKCFDHRRCWGSTSKIIASNFSTYNTINMEFQH